MSMLEHALPPSAPISPLDPTAIRRQRPLLMIGLGAWLIPGLGHFMMGRGRKGLLMLLAIGGLFAGGLFLTDFTCVNTYDYRLEFVAQIFAGAPTLASLHFTEGLEVTRFLPHFDVGRLYVAVAGLLNVVAISDALTLALAHNAQVTAQKQILQQRRLRDRLRQAEAAAEAAAVAAAAAAAAAAAEPPLPPMIDLPPGTPS